MFEKIHFLCQNYAEIKSEVGIQILKIAVFYPVFSSDEQRYNFDFINSFYKALAKNCMAFATEKLYPNILSEYNADTSPRKKFTFKKYSYIMECKVTYISEDIISVLFDVSLKRNGKIIRSKRISETWELPKNRIYPLSYFKKSLRGNADIKNFDGYYLRETENGAAIVLFSNSSENNTYNEKILKNADAFRLFESTKKAL